MYKNQKMRKTMGQIRGENIGGGRRNFSSKALPPQGKSEMAPLFRWPLELLFIKNKYSKNCVKGIKWYPVKSPPAKCTQTRATTP